MQPIIDHKSDKRTLWFALATAVFLLGSLYGLLRWSSRNAVNGFPDAGGQINTTSSFANDGDKTISFQGVTFNYNSSLASQVQAETKPAYLLRSSTDTGQGVAPPHIVFQLLGSYRSSHQESYFSPEISIFPIEEYRQALSKSPRYVNLFDHEVDTLKNMLSQRPASRKDEVPVLPFAIGGSQLFHARLEYVNFKGGTGVLFLTQYNIEPALVNNRGLTYAFQGLTDDHRYWVSATFPISLPFLPEGYDSERTDDYTLVIPRSSSGAEYASFEKEYGIYLQRVIAKLESLPPSSYEPDLETLKATIRSLHVKVEP